MSRDEIPLGDELATFLERHGRRQVGREVPAGWRRRRNRTPHGCYAAAGRWATRSDDVMYTEGVAMSTHGFVVQHAWLTDQQAEVIDLAWETPGEFYFGVPISDREVIRAMRASGMYASALAFLVPRGWVPGLG